MERVTRLLFWGIALTVLITHGLAGVVPFTLGVPLVNAPQEPIMLAFAWAKLGPAISLSFLGAWFSAVAGRPRAALMWTIYSMVLIPMALIAPFMEPSVGPYWSPELYEIGRAMHIWLSSIGIGGAKALGTLDLNYGLSFVILPLFVGLCHLTGAVIGSRLGGTLTAWTGAVLSALWIFLQVALDAAWAEPPYPLIILLLVLIGWLASHSIENDKPGSAQLLSLFIWLTVLPLFYWIYVEIDAILLDPADDPLPFALLWTVPTALLGTLAALSFKSQAQGPWDWPLSAAAIVATLALQLHVYSWPETHVFAQNPTVAVGILTLVMALLIIFAPRPRPAP